MPLSDRDPLVAPQKQGIRSYFSQRGQFYENLYALDNHVTGLQKIWYRFFLECRQHTFKALGDVADKRILDVGCGPGMYSIRLAEKQAEVFALDLSQEMLAYAQRHAEDRRVNHRITFVNADFLDWSNSADEQFHVSLIIGVFDYVAQPELWLQRLAALSANVCASFPVFHSIFSPIRLLRYKSLGVYYRLYRKTEILSLLDQAGFQPLTLIQGSQGFWVHASRKSKP